MCSCKNEILSICVLGQKRLKRIAFGIQVGYIHSCSFLGGFHYFLLYKGKFLVLFKTDVFVQPINCLSMPNNCFFFTENNLFNVKLLQGHTSLT